MLHLSFSTGLWVLAITLMASIGEVACVRCLNSLFNDPLWTASFSEEHGGYSDSLAGPIIGYWCSSNDCDNIKFRQAQNSPCKGSAGSYWTGWSTWQDNSASRQDCRDGYYVSQMRCKNSRCSNIQLQCQAIDTDVCEFRDRWGGGDYWIQENRYYEPNDWHSMVLIGVKCSGSKCRDHMVSLRRLSEKESCAFPNYKSNSPCKCVPCSGCQDAGYKREGCGGTSGGTCTPCGNSTYKPAGHTSQPEDWLEAELGTYTQQCLPCQRCDAGKFLESCDQSTGSRCVDCRDGCHSCRSDSLTRAEDKCLACADDFIENNERTKCIPECPIGQYPTGTADSGGSLYCEVCVTMPGCNVQAGCSGNNSGSYCPNGDCNEETHMASPDGVCQLLQPKPIVNVSGPVARIIWHEVESPASSFYSTFTWTATLQQESNPSTVQVALIPDGDCLKMNWDDFSGQPTKERSFRLRLQRVHKAEEWADGSEWSSNFEFSCECDSKAAGRLDKDGNPSVSLVQQQSNVRFQVLYFSYCATSIEVSRDVGSGFEHLSSDSELSVDAMDCSATPRTFRDNLAIDNQIEVSLGQTIIYRFSAKNSGIEYSADVTISHRVEFWGIVKGTVRSQNSAGVQMENVNITVAMESESELDSSLGRSVTWSDLTRLIGGGNSFEYSILVQSPWIRPLEGYAPVTISAQYPSIPRWTNCAAVGYECVCAGGRVRLTNGDSSRELEVTSVNCTPASFPGPAMPGTGALRCDCSEVLHRFDCEMQDFCDVTDITVAPEKQTRHVQLNLGHTGTIRVNFFDMTSYTVAGTVTIYNTAPYTDTRRACGLNDVEVCFDDALGVEKCTQTDTRGRYFLTVSVGQSVRIRPRFFNSTSADFNPEYHTLPPVFSSQDGWDFEYRRQKRLHISVGGGLSFNPIGTFVLWFTINSCPEYTAHEEEISGKRVPIYLGPADFTVEVLKFLPDIDDDPDITANTVTKYLSDSNTRTKYVNFFSRRDAREEEAVLDTNGNAYVEFMFRSQLRLQMIAELDTGSPVTVDCLGATVAAQNSEGNLTVVAYEHYGMTKEHKVKGKITVKDQVSDRNYACSSSAGCTMDISVVQHEGQDASGIMLPLWPGQPELISPHHRFFYFYWDVPGRLQPERETFEVLVTGQRKMGDRLSVIISKGNPRTILYDPPGGSSFSELLEGTELSTGLTLTSGQGSAKVDDTDHMLGFSTKIDVCAPFGVVCHQLLDVKTALGHTHDTEKSEGNQKVNQYTFKLVVENSLQTSGEPDVPGFYSDIVVSSSMTMNIERTRRLKYSRPDECPSSETSAENEGIDICDDIVLGPALEGFSIKTFFDIEFVELPKIDDSMTSIQRRLEDDEYENNDDGREERSIDRNYLAELNATKANWNRLMALHEKRADSEKLAGTFEEFARLECNKASDECTKVNGEGCLPGDLVELPCGSITDTNIFNFGREDNRIFFSGGGTSFGFSTETTFANVERHEQTFELRESDGLRFDNQMTIGGIFSDLEHHTKWVIETHQAKETERETAHSKRVSFTLSDTDVGDYFDVEILFDTEYGVPYFKTLSGESMCPRERGTESRMSVEMTLPGLSTIRGIPAGAPYVVPIELENTGVEDVGEYVLTYDLASNPYGLRMSVDGHGLAERLIRSIPAGQAVRVNVQMEPSPGTYDYENIKLQIFARCDDSVGDEIVVSLHWARDCAKVEFGGIISDRNTFIVTKNQVPSDTLTIVAHNPDHFFSPWDSHPTLQTPGGVYVQYRRAGDNIWRRARRADSDFAEFGLVTDSAGFAEVDVDVTEWKDGQYELCLFTSCGNLPAPYGSSQSAIISGLVDRQVPRLYSAFAEPSDGTWAPGDRIAASMTEDIDCRRPYTFNAHMVISHQDSVAGNAEEGRIVVNNEHLDIKCYRDGVDLAFSAYSIIYQIRDLPNKHVTVYLENVRDLAGNFQEGTITWSFDVLPFNLKNTAMVISLYFKDLEIQTYETDPPGFEARVTREVCMLVDRDCKQVEDGTGQNTDTKNNNGVGTRRQLGVADVRVKGRVYGGLVWADVQLPETEGGLPLAAKLYGYMGNASRLSTVPQEMLLSKAELHTVSYREPGADVEEPVAEQGEENRGKTDETGEQRQSKNAGNENELGLLKSEWALVSVSFAAGLFTSIFAACLYCIVARRKTRNCRRVSQVPEDRSQRGNGRQNVTGSVASSNERSTAGLIDHRLISVCSLSSDSAERPDEEVGEHPVARPPA